MRRILLGFLVLGGLGGAAFLALPLGTRALVSDIGVEPIYLIRGTTRWRGDNGQVVKENAADVVINTASETICVQWQAKAGLLGNRAVVRLVIDDADSGTTTTYTGRVRVGTAGTTGDTQVIANATWMTAVGRAAGTTIDFERRSATLVSQRGGLATGSNSAYMEATSSGARAADVAVSDMDANDVYFSLTMQPNNTTDTLTIYGGSIAILHWGA